MKISARQVQAALDSYVRYGSKRGEGIGSRESGAPHPKAPDEIRRQFELLPDERDIVVHDLRAKIRSGNYFVSSIKIVDALLGRLAANLIG